MQAFHVCSFQGKLALANSSKIQSPLCNVNAFLFLQAPARVRDRKFLRAVSRSTVRPLFNTNSFLKQKIHKTESGSGVLETSPTSSREPNFKF